MSNDHWLHWPQTRALINCFQQGELRFVGGAVRDLLLDRAVTDVDAATTLLPEQTTLAIEKAGHKAIPTGIAHGTVTALIGEKTFEITTLRRDTSCDGRHAEVEYTTDWEEDARRRDFTMNALYLTPTGEYIDYFGGMDDAKTGNVRFIGDAADRVQEDYLRILRFFRFYAHYGNTPPDRKALDACKRYREKIESLSGERIRHEILKLLTARHVSHALNLMRHTEVMESLFGVLPVLATVKFLEEQNAAFAQDGLLKLALLLRTVPEEATIFVAQRWKLSGAENKRLQKLVREPVIGLTISKAEQKSTLRRLGKVDYEAMLAISAAQKGSYSAYAPLRKLAKEWEIPEFPIRGEDLLKQGFKQGVAIGEALKKIESLWEESDYTLSREALLKKI